MKSFEEFTIEDGTYIVGGDLVPTYVGRNGDFYDTEHERFIFLEE